MKLSKEELKIIAQSLQQSMKYYEDSQKPVKDLYEKVINEIVRICEKTKLKNLR